MLRHKDDGRFYFCFAGFTTHSAFISSQQVLKHRFRSASEQLPVLTLRIHSQVEGRGFWLFFFSELCLPTMLCWIEIVSWNIIPGANPIFHLYGLKLGLKCQYHFKSRYINWIFTATCVLFGAARGKMHLWHHFICSCFKTRASWQGTECRD